MAEDEARQRSAQLNLFIPPLSSLPPPQTRPKATRVLTSPGDIQSHRTTSQRKENGSQQTRLLRTSSIETDSDRQSCYVRGDGRVTEDSVETKILSFTDVRRRGGFALGGGAEVLVDAWKEGRERGELELFGLIKERREEERAEEEVKKS